MFVVLDGTNLSITKSRSKPDDRRKQQLVVNVRSEKVEVDIDRLELVVYKQGRERPLRLQVINEDTCRRWHDALKAARACDIEQFYELGDLLGTGAYGQVFEAFDVRTREKRAAKIVTRSSNLKSVEHLSREIDIMKSISHPGIVQTYQIFDLKRKIYIVMEYVPGGDLFDFVAQHEVLSEAQASQTMGSIFEAVAYLHSRNIVHRDLKPENILCVEKRWPLKIKITDFGFSTVLDPDSVDNVMRTPVGTAYFMAPEIILNKGHGAPVDLWACGVILYTILTGRLPFPGRNRDEYFQNVSLGKPLFPPSLWKGISRDALYLVKGLLNVDPKKRLTALGAMNHNWIASADEYALGVAIRRNRSNLHSSRRRLYKARSSMIAVAMAQKFKATALVDLVEKIPVVVDKVGEGTKKAALKTADNLMDVGDRVGEGTRKIAQNVGEGSKKVAEGVKKTGRGVEQGARKMGEGVKKTADGIGNGAKKAAGGIGTGVKKTGEGIANGAKKTKESIGTGVKKTTVGIKKTGEGIKKGAEKVKIDREMLEKLRIPMENLRPRFGGSQAGSQQDSTGTRRRDRDVFRRRRRGQGTTDRSEGTRGLDSDVSADMKAVPVDDLSSMEETEAKSEVARSETARSASVKEAPLGNASGVSSVENMRGAQNSWAEYGECARGSDAKLVSKPESSSASEEFVDAPLEFGYVPPSAAEESKSLVVSDDLVSSPPGKLGMLHNEAVSNESDAIKKHTSEMSNESSGSGGASDKNEKNTSNVSNLSAGSGRPKLAPLLGLVGFPPHHLCDVGDSGGSSDGMELLDEDDATAASKLRQAAAMLLATSDCSNPRTGFHKNGLTLGAIHPPVSSTIDSPCTAPGKQG